MRKPNQWPKRNMPWLIRRRNSDLYGHDRQLPTKTDPPLDSSKMTVETCLDHYESLSFGFAGLEYGHDCYCGSTRPNWYWISEKKECDHSCRGSATQ